MEKNLPILPPEESTKKDVLEKIKMANKRKSTILLPMGMPSKRGRGQAVALSSTCTTPKLQRILQKSTAEVSKDILVTMDKYSPKKDSASTALEILSDEKNIVNKNYYKDILDHDYCQNVPKTENRAQTDSSLHEADILELEDGEIPEEFDVVENAENRTSKLCDSQTKNDELNKQCISQLKGKKQGGRNYRKREGSPVCEKDDKFFDKIPSYYTALSLSGTKSSKSKKENIVPKENCSSGITIQDYFEPNPTPQGDNSVYSRLPAYHSCFTNSTKYDSNDVSIESKSSSGYSSRSRSPITSRLSSSSSCSRSPSRSRSRDKRGRRRRKRSGTYDSISRSRSRSYGSSCSR